MSDYMKHLGTTPYGGPAGKTFYVNTNTASDARNADRPWYVADEVTCFATLQAAIDATVADRGDVIYVARGGYETSSAIDFNKNGISVIGQTWGMNPHSRGEYCSIYASAGYTDGPVANITAPCFIQGLGFISRDAGTTFWSGAAALIGGLATASPFGVHMKWCRFPKWGLDNRIGLSIEGSSNTLIEECDFEGAFETGIYVQGACGHLVLRRNTFALCTYAITHGAFSDAGVNTQFLYGPGNVTVSPTKFLDSNSNAGLGNIFENSYGTAVGTATNDISVADLLTAGWTCAGNNYQSEDPGPT